MNIPNIKNIFFKNVWADQSQVVRSIYNDNASYQPTRTPNMPINFPSTVETETNV